MFSGFQNSEGNQAVVSPLPTARRRRGFKAGIYLLPNMITASSLFFGFLAMKLAVDARMGLSSGMTPTFVMAAYAILVAAVCDGLDGSVARLTRTQSSFGVQFDSLCDVVSFGIAPAVLAYHFALKDLGRLGFGAAFIFAACGAMRLARFNVQSSVGKANGNFTGIPIPMAAAPVAVYILAQDTLAEWGRSAGSPQWQKTLSAVLGDPQVNAWILFGIMICLALGMVSTFEYISHKAIKLPRKHPFRVFAAVLMALALLFSVEFTVTLAILLLVYCVHGPILWFVYKRHKGEDEEELFATPEEDDEEEEGARR